MTIKLVMFIISMSALWYSQDETISLSMALFLCFVAGVNIIGVFMCEDEDYDVQK